MAFIFEDEDRKENSGRVVVLEQDDAMSGSILDVDGWDGFGSFKAIFTRLEIAEMTNHQFLHTLGNRVYLYVFGDRIGQLALTGLAFYDNCTDNEKIGVVHALEYYRANRLSKRADPIRITIDPSTVFECYLQSFRAATVNTAQRMYQFHLDLALLPEDEQPLVDSAIDTVTRPIPAGIV